jgi:hypothetical protein
MYSLQALGFYITSDLKNLIFTISWIIVLTFMTFVTLGDFQRFFKRL